MEVEITSGQFVLDRAPGRHTSAPRPMRAAPLSRPRVEGKFLSQGGRKLYVRGVTYGTFAPDKHGSEYSRAAVETDFAAMKSSGMNAVRTYTVPPRWLLDCALEHELLVMVGLPWEQHVAFAGDRERMRSVRDRVRAGVSACAGHPAVLAYAIGNEIPAPIVRWHGARRIEKFLQSLYDAAKSTDPAGLVTYVNFPSTEYLELPFLDFTCFNVYLEQRERLEAYLYRLQNLTGDRPLVLAEIGLDSLRNGEQEQARALSWQITSAFAGGAAGVFTFAWTDEWHRGGAEIDDWDFGLTTRAREPKPALEAVSEAYDRVPPPPQRTPRVSVVVCTYNGSRTLRECLARLMVLDYPDYEVIVVDDGSSDNSATIAADYDVVLLRTPNRGLASARNAGLEQASGEIIAYIDDDAVADPHWLSYLAAEFERGRCAVGGPNIPPGGDGLVAECVARAPGGPIHVLTSDSEAEHIPGCNMAIRADALRSIGGFDTQFTAAGDDVDVCWRLQESGGVIGFAPAAFVWHHRRNAVKAYWRQQRGYGKAEALLERKWPERYNAAGHVRWAGRLYGSGRALPLLSRRRRVRHGSWGLGLFQSIYEPAEGMLGALPLMPEWYLLTAALAVLCALGAAWPPLLLALPVLAGCLAIAVAGAAKSAARACFGDARALPRRRKLTQFALTTTLHLVQPMARLHGRLAHGLSPWRLRACRSFKPALPQTFTAWSESWIGAEERLRALEAALRARGAVVARGGDFDRWDLEARLGTLSAIRTRMAIEEHGGGRQLIRLRCWPRLSRVGAALLVMFAALTVATAAVGAAAPSVALAVIATCLLARKALEAGMATAAVAAAFAESDDTARPLTAQAPERAHPVAREAEAPAAVG